MILRLVHYAVLRRLLQLKLLLLHEDLLLCFRSNDWRRLLLLRYLALFVSFSAHYCLAQSFLINHIELLVVCLSHTSHSVRGHWRRIKLVMDNLESIANNIVSLGQCTERCKYLIVDTLSKQDPIERVLKSVPATPITFVPSTILHSLRVVDASQSLLDALSCLFAALVCVRV